MKRFLLNPLVLILILILVASGGGLAILPGQMAAQFKKALESRIGRNVLIAGKSQLVFTPVFGLALHDVSIAGASAMAEPVVHAGEVIVPISMGQVLSRRVSIDNLIVRNADIEVVINGQGHANVLIEQTPVAAKTDENSVAETPMYITLKDSRLHFSDLRNSNEFEVSSIDAIIDSNDSVNAQGLAFLKDRRIHFTFALNSLARAFTEGSPLDLNVDGVDSAFSFSGRIATTDQLSLAGQASLDSSNAPRLWQWLGAKIADFDALKKMSLRAALDAQGSVFFMRQAKLKLGEMNATGDLSFSNSGERPNLTATLKFDTLDLSAYQSSQITRTKGWSEQPIDLSPLGAVDAQFQLSSGQLIYGTLKTGAVTMEGALNDHVFNAAIKSDAVAGGSADFRIAFDAKQLPPHLQLDVNTSKVKAKGFLGAFGQGWLLGDLTGTGHFEALGESQAAMISMLKGDIDFKAESATLRGLEHSVLAPFALQSNAAAKFTIAEGVATLGENNLGATGEIDILRQALSLTIAVPPQQKITVTGPWNDPKISAVAPAQQ